MSGGYEKVLRAVRAARAALRQSEVLAGLGLTALAAGIAIVALVALDNLFYLPAWTRIALLLAAAGAMLFSFWRAVVQPASRPLTDDAVAVRMEQAAGGMENRLINALQLGREETGGLSGAFAREIVSRGAEMATRYPTRRVVDGKRLARALGLGAAAAVLVIAYGALLPDQFAHAVTRYSRPGAFVPPLVNIGVGQDLTIRELAENVQSVVGYAGKIVFDTTKPDGTPRKLMDVRRLQALGWEARVSLGQGLRQAYSDYVHRVAQA